MPSVGRSPFTEDAKARNRKVDDRVKPEKRKAMDKAASDPRHKNERVPVDDSVTTVKIEDEAVTVDKIPLDATFVLFRDDASFPTTDVRAGQLVFDITDGNLYLNTSTTPSAPTWFALAFA